MHWLMAFRTWRNITQLICVLTLVLTFTGGDDDEGDDDGESDDEDEQTPEEKDHLVAELYKHMEDKGSPINNTPAINGKGIIKYPRTANKCQL